MDSFVIFGNRQSKVNGRLVGTAMKPVVMESGLLAAYSTAEAACQVMLDMANSTVCPYEESLLVLRDGTSCLYGTPTLNFQVRVVGTEAFYVHLQNK